MRIICLANFHRGSAPLAAATLPVTPTTWGSFSPKPPQVRALLKEKLNKKATVEGGSFC